MNGNVWHHCSMYVSNVCIVLLLQCINMGKCQYNFQIFDIECSVIGKVEIIAQLAAVYPESNAAICYFYKEHLFAL